MNKIKFAVAALFIGSVLFALANNANAYPPFLNKAKKFGAKDCTFCHVDPLGGPPWNERGKWLIGEKSRRKAQMVDIEWLAEYPADGKAGGGAATGGATAGDTVKVAGDWDAKVDVQGQEITFVLKLKQEGDKITGSQESDQGTIEISKGVVKGDTISYSIEVQGSEVIMTGKVKADAIDGDFDFGGGQMKGKWSAKKKK